MAGRGPQTFKKKQKEQRRKEKREEKLARRLERKQQAPSETEEPTAPLTPAGGESGQTPWSRARERQRAEYALP
jgi:hypothetical protein